MQIDHAPISSAIAAIRARAGLSQEALARYLGVSFVSINRWERGASAPSPVQAEKILHLKTELESTGRLPERPESHVGAFASHGVRERDRVLPLFQEKPNLNLSASPGTPIISRVRHGSVFTERDRDALNLLLANHREAARTVPRGPSGGVSAGKNSYTYDAHTYHTKVPPQGIAELTRHYLPEGGLMLDPFGGSGMTGVAAAVTGHDCILNELSPAACFIASRFLARVSSQAFGEAVRALLDVTDDVRKKLYTTTCRECGKRTELLYTVWSYRVICSHCNSDFQLWSACRRYGSRVREHKILREFECPSCGRHVIKSRLRRTVPQPVQVGYFCCGSRQQEITHDPSDNDLALIHAIAEQPLTIDGFFPTTALPDGVNLSQPKKHGLTSIDKFYTPRNLSAMSHLWQAIHRVDDIQIAAHLAFVFTSLYQRVTKLSEFRFWGGSGNAARFNVPFIFNESNVFVTFERKARTIQDHLATTATHYKGSTVVVNASATRLSYLPDRSIDFIFTDPPFGANINYSEMNILWESWLGDFTDSRDEAIVNRVQGKDVSDYGRLMTESLAECYRVLRPNHWLVLMFMNTSARVWEALRAAILNAGFEIRQVDSFDKQHATFKQFVSENAAGEDLVIHCFKPTVARPIEPALNIPAPRESVRAFLQTIDPSRRVVVYLHVGRQQEIDMRQLYSDWMAIAVRAGIGPLGFAEFRSIVEEHFSTHDLQESADSASEYADNDAD